jgi:HAD superfamily hydrolase (TIGR01509 family)
VGEQVLVSSRALLTIFLDDGGVMNLNHLRGPQWQRLVGEFLAPLLGGAPAAWAEANRVVVEELLINLWTNPVADYRAYHAQEARAWLLGMCRHVGVAPPPNAEILALHDRATAWITRRVRSAAPGAVEAIRALHGRGHRLMTASGEDSNSLDGYLEGMGVRACFERLYGPDLINTTKHGPLYYRRVLEDAGVAPAEALFVDDSPAAVGWIRDVGARAIHVGSDVAALAEVPNYLLRLPP